MKRKSAQRLVHRRSQQHFLQQLVETAQCAHEGQTRRVWAAHPLDGILVTVKSNEMLMHGACMRPKGMPREGGQWPTRSL